MRLAPTAGQRDRPTLLRASMAASSAIAIVATWSEPTPVRLAATLAVLVSVGAGLFVTRSAAERMALVAALAILAVGNGGLPDTTDPDTAWMLTVSLAAYPLLGVVFIEHVGRHRRLRDGDLVVECVLLGSAAAIVMQALVDWRFPVIDHPFGPGFAALAAVVASLDLALVMVASRALPVPSARQAPIALLGAAALALGAVHISSALRMAEGASGGALEYAGAVPFVLLAAVAVLEALTRGNGRLVEESERFSYGHAVVVGGSVVAVPLVVAFQVMADLTVSMTVAIGAAASAVILAWHIVTLLRERAASEHRALHDHLTDLPNRTMLLDRLERAIAHAKRHDLPVGVLYLDLDGFKDINDTLGHDAGDHLLQVTARRLDGCAREEDTVARLAGDEFAILLPHLKSADDVLIVADRVLEALSEPVSLDGHRLRSQASVGVAVFPDDGITPNELLTAADSAMYRAKERGGASVGVFSAEMSRHAASRLEIESALHEGLERDEIVLHYQPIIDAVDGRIAGAEALVRWQHPTRGLLSPVEFIPVAEQSDLIVLLGRKVLQVACQELARWAVAGYADRFITVNVSARQLSREHDLVSDVTAALRETGVDPQRLVLELTESTAVDDVECVADRLRELRDLGVRAAIDDFGTGYCGLQYLGDLPVSTLKLDRSFVQSMTPSSAAIVAATIAMAHSLGMYLVAEGVETAEQQRFLTRKGCDRLQGYHIGRPMPAEDLLSLLDSERVAGESVVGTLPVAAGLEDGRAGSWEAPIPAAT